MGHIKRNIYTALFWMILSAVLLANSPDALAKPTQESKAARQPESEQGLYLIGEEKITMACGTLFQDPGVIAIGREGEDVGESVKITSDLCCWKTGSYTLEYSFEKEGGTYRVSRELTLIPHVLPEIVPTEKVIYLSFDDGPCEYTPRVLELLKKYDAKATFFVILEEQNPYLAYLSNIVSQGHTVGIHCSNHDYGKLYASEESYFEDFMKAQQILYERTGQLASVSRFPGGSVTARAYLGRKTTGGFEMIEQRLRDMGIRYYDWNVKTEGEGSSAKDMYYRFIAQVPKSETPVCLFHDTRLYSVNALESLLQWGVENGYTFQAMDATTPEVHG